MRTLWKLNLPSFSTIRIGELPPKSMGFTYSKHTKTILICDPNSGTIWAMSPEGSLSMWMKRTDITSPTSITSCNPNEVIVFSGGEDIMWWIQVSSKVCQKLAGRGAYLSFIAIPDKNADGVDGCNLIAKADRRVYLVRRKAHRVAAVGEMSHLSYVLGSGKKGFSMAASPLSTDIDSPSSICYAKDKNALFISETGNKIVRKIDPANLQTSGVFGMRNGNDQYVSFSSPSDLATDGNRVAVADQKSIHMIKDDQVTTIHKAEGNISGLAFVDQDNLLFGVLS